MPKLITFAGTPVPCLHFVLKYVSMEAFNGARPGHQSQRAFNRIGLILVGVQAFK